MAHNLLKVIILGGAVLLFGILVFPSFHSIVGGMDISNLSYINGAWVTFQPYLFIVVIAYAAWYFTHRR